MLQQRMYRKTRSSHCKRLIAKYSMEKVTVAHNRLQNMMLSLFYDCITTTSMNYFVQTSFHYFVQT